LSIAAVAGIHELDPNLCRGSSVEPPDRGLTMEGLPPRGQPFSFPLKTADGRFAARTERDFREDLMVATEPVVKKPRRLESAGSARAG
jgi:hypothetical protein